MLFSGGSDKDSRRVVSSGEEVLKKGSGHRGAQQRRQFGGKLGSRGIRKREQEVGERRRQERGPSRN